MSAWLDVGWHFDLFALAVVVPILALIWLGVGRP